MTAYDEIKAVNWSTLKHMAVSPLLYCWRLTHPQPRTPALVVGTAIHCAVFEANKFDSRFAIFDGTRRGREWGAWQMEHPGVESLKPDEAGRVRAVVAAVKGHRVAWRILEPCRNEELMTWVDPDTGLACKARLDAICPAYVADLKSACDPAPRAFSRQSANLLYHGQLAWYHDGAVVAGKVPGDTRPYIVAVDSDEPYDVAAYQLGADALAVGRALYRALLRKLLDCTAADWWPGCAPDLQQLSLPQWGDGVTFELEQGAFDHSMSVNEGRG